MAGVYRPNGAASASDSQPSLSSYSSGSSSNTLYSSASCSSAGHYPACPRCESYPHRYEADCSPDGRRPLRRDTHVTSPPGQPLRGRWEVDTSGTSSKSTPAQPHKALKVLCGEGSDLQLETRGKAALEARIQITGRGWTYPQIEVVTEYGEGIIEMVSTTPKSTCSAGKLAGTHKHGLTQARHGSQRFRLTARTLGGDLIVRVPPDFSGKVVANAPGSVSFSADAARLLSGSRTTTVGPNGCTTEYSTRATDAKSSRFPDFVHVSPGEGTVRVLVGDEGLLRANGLVAGVLGAKQWAEDEMARRRSSSRRL
ncbi:hypothetical protein RhiJN_28499 [Ceratobasidium sp. AG-Ba]|nr:hypothetical protein RhiJN_28499 [Ceratobasidium sp. AG-Ba]